MSTAKAAIVTGASRGIGEAIARALATDGTAVGIVARSSDALQAVAADITAQGGIAVARECDVTEGAAVERAVHEMVAELPHPVGLLVNNAGRIDHEVPLWEADADEWREVVTTNLIGSFNFSRAIIPHMLAAGGGRVIELASGAGAKDWDRASAYVASKSALIRNVGHLHEAGFDLGLRSFAIAPGTVKTEMTQSMRTHADRTEFTPVSCTQNMVLAVHRGDLDEWSGKYLRVTHDSPESLAAYESEYNAPPPNSRRLGIIPWGDDDPQVKESLLPK